MSKHPKSVDDLSDKIQKVQDALKIMSEDGHMSKHTNKILEGMSAALDTIFRTVHDGYHIRPDALLNENFRKEIKNGC